MQTLSASPCTKQGEKKKMEKRGVRWKKEKKEEEKITINTEQITKAEIKQ